MEDNQHVFDTFGDIYFLIFFFLFLKGVGVERHEEKAMEWFKKAADQGHPHASYNLAIGHLKGLKSQINQRFGSNTFISWLVCNTC